MKLFVALLFMLVLPRPWSVVSADIPPEFFRALRTVETSDRSGIVIGDHGRALGPYQITWAYWRDARMPGRYTDVVSEPYARQVVTRYMQRYAPEAIKSGDLIRLARIHNGGPTGDLKSSTIIFATRFKSYLKPTPQPDTIRQ